jgi:serine/threonine-protein kinase
MGVVYRAWDSVLEREVALKTLRSGVADTSEVARFYREARAAARLEHGNVMPVLDVGEHLGLHYYAMPILPGGNFATHRDRFSAPRAAATLVEAAARGVGALHGAGIIHRDLKPANILLASATGAGRGDETPPAEPGANWIPKIADFGLAKFLDAASEITQPGQTVGTPVYMAPEQAAGRADLVGARTDVWALGVILYELLTGQRPFQSSSQSAVLRAIQDADPPRPGALCRAVDRDLETIVLHCLHKDPAARYPDANALADDLARWLRGEAIAARRQPRPRRLLRHAPQPPGVLHPGPARRRGRGSALPAGLAGPEPADQAAAAAVGARRGGPSDRRDGSAGPHPLGRRRRRLAGFSGDRGRVHGPHHEPGPAGAVAERPDFTVPAARPGAAPRQQPGAECRDLSPARSAATPGGAGELTAGFHLQRPAGTATGERAEVTLIPGAGVDKAG